MKKGRRFVALLLSFTILFCFASCNSGVQEYEETEQNIDQYEDEYEEFEEIVDDYETEDTTESETIEGQVDMVTREVTADDITFYTIFDNHIYMNYEVDLSRWIQIDGYNLEGEPYIYYEGVISEMNYKTRKIVDGYHIFSYPCGDVIEMVNNTVKIEDFSPDQYVDKEEPEEFESFETIGSGNLTEEILYELVRNDLYDEAKDNQAIAGHMDRYTVVDDTSLYSDSKQPIYLESKEVYDKLIIITLSQNGSPYTLNGQFAATYAIDWSRSPKIEFIDDNHFMVKYYIKN